MPNSSDLSEHTQEIQSLILSIDRLIAIVTELVQAQQGTTAALLELADAIAAPVDESHQQEPEADETDFNGRPAR
jgi:hypothetical protein